VAESRTAVLAAFLGNSALAVLKGTAAAATGSAAMLAETLHSAADAGNQALLFLGMRLARRPPDARHPFGHGKNVYFWAFVVSVLLFSLGGAFSIAEAIRSVLHRGDAEHGSLGWAYGVLAGGFVFEAVSLVFAFQALAALRKGRSLREYWRENRDPTLPTVLLEDTAALLSLVIAAGGLAASQATGRVVWDAAASALIGLILIGVAIWLAFENYSLLIGEAAPADVETTIRRAVEAENAVGGVESLHTMHVGPHAILVALGVRFRPDLSTREIERVVGRLHERVRTAVAGSTDARLVVIEPASGAAAPSPERPVREPGGWRVAPPGDGRVRRSPGPPEPPDRSRG
jgi:cation diffusion facilitator family transporter